MSEPAMTTVQVEGQTKYAVSYPLTNEDGEPLLDRGGKPRFTNIIADTPEELVKKMATANIEVARALDRSNKRYETLSTTKPTPRTVAAEMKPRAMSQEEKIQVGLDAQDPRKAAEAIQRVVDAAVPVAQITETVRQQSKKVDLEERIRIARDFVTSHREYYPVEANNALLNDYLNRNELEFTVANLEFAAAAVSNRLARKPKPASRPEIRQTAPENEVPENEPSNPGTPPPQPRRAPAGGIRNSQVSGTPTSDTVLTRQQALDMLYKNPRQYEAWMRDPKKNAILNRALAGGR